MELFWAIVAMMFMWIVASKVLSIANSLERMQKTLDHIQGSLSECQSSLREISDTMGAELQRQSRGRLTVAERYALEESDNRKVQRG